MGTARALRSSQLVHLTRKEVKELPKPRVGFENFVPEIMEMYKSNLERLEIPGLDPDAVLDELSEYVALLPVIATAQKQLAMAQETALLHASNAWRATLLAYDRAVPLARVDPDIARAIADFQQFMKNGPRVKKPGTPGTGT